MAGLASQTGDIDSSVTAGVTNGFQGSIMWNRYCVKLQAKLLLSIHNVRTFFSKLWASLMRNKFPKLPSGAPLHTLSKLHDVAFGIVSLLFWGSVLLYLRSPKGGCYSISNDLSCSVTVTVRQLFGIVHFPPFGHNTNNFLITYQLRSYYFCNMQFRYISLLNEMTHTGFVFRSVLCLDARMEHCDLCIPVFSHNLLSQTFNKLNIHDEEIQQPRNIPMTPLTLKLFYAN